MERIKAIADAIKIIDKARIQAHSDGLMCGWQMLFNTSNYLHKASIEAAAEYFGK